MIAVTGATGLLGSSIVRKLIEANEFFVAFKRRNSNTSLLDDINEKITWRDTDLLDPVALSEALQDVTSVIHSAGLVSFHARDKKKLYNVNVKGTRNIINACLDTDVKRFVHVSSVAALGRPKKTTELDETQKWMESPLNTVYAESKYLAELEVMRGHEEGLSVVIVNPSVVLGPGDWNRSSAKIFGFAWRENIFYTEGSMNYVDVNDVTEVIYKLLHQTENGERFILSAGNITYRSLLEKIATHFDKKPPTIKIGKNILQILARAEGLRSFFTGSTPLITKETAQLTNSPVTYNNKKIKSK